MADLPNGTTIGGKKIIHKGIANNHRHDASDIDGLNTLATGSQGDGGGIDADVLSGNTYGDLSNEFLQTQNDSISELILANHPTQNNNAVSRLYLQDSIPQNLRSGNFYGITSIGDQSSSTYDYSVLDSFNIRFSEMECLVNGYKYTIPSTTIDIRDVSANFENKNFHAYVVTNTITGIAEIIIQEEYELNQNNKIFIGTLETNSSSISSFTPIEGIERVGIEKYMLSTTPKEYAIPVSDVNGRIDDAWIYGARGETSITLTGPDELPSKLTGNYFITNYNSFSTYELSEANEFFGAVFTSEEEIQLEAPLKIPFEEVRQLVISKDGFDTAFDITLRADPPLTISGPTEINSGGANYNYTIGNYNDDYDYVITTTHGTVTRTEDVVTLITPATLENDVTATLTVSRDGSSDSLDILMLSVPPFEITGRNEVWPGADFQFTIDPFDSSLTYNISTTFPYTYSAGIITVSVPPGTENEYTETLSVTSGSTVAEKTFTILGKPDPIDIVDYGNGTLVIYDEIGQPEPALHYTVNVYGNFNTSGGTSITYGAIRTENFSLFTSGSELTLNIYDSILRANGGKGGGNYSSNDGSPGNACLVVSAVPTHLTISNSSLIAGGGGGGSAVRYTGSTSNAGKGGSTSYTTDAIGPGGGGATTPGEVTEVTEATSNSTTTNASQGSGNTAGTGGYARHTEEETRFDSNNNPYTVNHTFNLYGGDGGALGTQGTDSTGTGGVETVEYVINSLNVTTTYAVSGDLGVGGAAGYAIFDMGGSNILSFTNINNIIVGRSDV